MVSFSVRSNGVPWLTAQEIQYSTLVYDATLNTNTADFVFGLCHKTPVYKLNHLVNYLVPYLDLIAGT